MSVKTAASGFRQVIAWILTLLPIGMFYGILARYYTPLPVEDDYDAILGFALTWQHTATWAQRVAVFLTHQHNEYKPFLQNAVVIAQLAIRHRFHPGLWIWTGNLLVIVCLVPLWLACAPGKAFTSKLLLFVPVVWIFVNLNYAETLDYALSDMQEVPVVLFSLVAIYLATRESKTANWFSFLFSFLACASYANAFLLAPMGLAFFGRKGKRHLLVGWSLSFLLVLVPFLYRYHASVHMRGSIRQYVLFTVAMAGAGISYFRFFPQVLPVLLGLTVLGLALYATVARLDRVNPFAYWTAMLMIGSCMLASYGRAGGGIRLAFALRYRIYGDLAIASLYLLLVSYVELRPRADSRRKLLYVSALSFAVFYGLISDAVGLRFLQSRRSSLVYGMDHYIASHGVESPMVAPDLPVDTPERGINVIRVRDTLTEAVREGIYEIPAHY